ncbi:MAG: GDSL-type esterase/lipase family protein [Cyanobacteria bacterium J06638_20]
MNDRLRRLGDRHLKAVLRQSRDRLWLMRRQAQWSWRHWQTTWKQRRSLPLWVYISLAVNLILLLFVLQLWARQQNLSRAVALMQTTPASTYSSFATATEPDLGLAHRLTYEQWVELLAKEAEVAAFQQPERLTILLGDSISLWFPNDLLSASRTWLNQGISGENSTGLLRRLNILDETTPDTIFLMIGINDLLRGDSDELILSNHRQIIRYLQTAHPTTQIVVQSILPHSAEAATWEGRDRLLAVPNQRIVNLNHELEAIAAENGVDFLNLYPLFTDDWGNLPMTLSTDGLHLNREGYMVWRSGLQLYFQEIASPQG